MGGAMICRDCDAAVRAEMEALRGAGKPVNVLHIAKRMFRETNPVEGYLLRDIPAVLWARVQHQAINEGVSQREILLRALYEYLDTHTG
jgi:hypothetical protein